MAGRRYGDVRMNPKGMVFFPPYVTTDKLAHCDMVDVDPYAQSASQEFPLGTLMIWGDRKFRYSKLGATAPGAGEPTQGAVAQHADANSGRAVAVTAAVGDTTLSITGTTNLTSTANYYGEGYVYVNSKTAGATCLRIKSHPALNAAATKVITLYDPVPVAITAGTDTVGFRKNLFDGVIAHAGATETAAPCGIALLDFTAAYYCWLQTGGPCLVLCNTTIGVGEDVMVGVSASEADPSAADASALQRIGFAMIAGVANTNTLVWLTLD